MKSKYNINNPMAPPWLMYPCISRYSIGWRMGYGETYIHEFREWFSDLTLEEQREYEGMFPPPKAWLDWYQEEVEDDFWQDLYDEEGILHWNKDGRMKYSREDLVKQMKALGKKVKNFDEAVWQQKRYSIILNGNFAKFIQNPDLKQFLIQTGDQVLVEASPYDKIWGIGMTADHEHSSNPRKWNGLNLLGFALMEVRDEIVRVCKNESLLNFQELQAEFG